MKNDKNLSLLEAQVRDFNELHKANIKLVEGKKFSISNNRLNNNQVIQISSEDIQGSSISELQWHVESSLNLIKNGRLLSSGKQLGLFVIFIVGLISLNSLVSSIQLVSADWAQVVSLSIGMSIFYLILGIWSRAKVLKSDLEASTKFHEGGLIYLSKKSEQHNLYDLELINPVTAKLYSIFLLHPSFLVRYFNLSKVK